MNPEEGRARFFGLAKGATPIVAAVSRDATFLVSTRDEAVGGRLFAKGSRSEMRTLAITVSLLRQLGHLSKGHSSVLLDVGANIGTTSIPALLRHGFRRAIGCEPEPENYLLLRLNALVNGVEAFLTALPVAVSNETGTALLALHTWNSGGHQVVAGAGPLAEGVDAPTGERVTVEKVTMDFLAERGLFDPAEIGLVWIDAQGHEGHIVDGARHLTRRGVPFVLEFYPALLEQAGGLSRVYDLARDQYTHFVDLRRDGRAGGELSLHPTRELPIVAAELAADRTSRFTDILLLRQPRRRPTGVRRLAAPGA